MTKDEVDIIENNLLTPEEQYKKALKELNIKEDTSLQEIKRMRKLDILKYHPDKFIQKENVLEEEI